LHYYYLIFTYSLFIIVVVVVTIAPPALRHCANLRYTADVYSALHTIHPVLFMSTIFTCGPHATRHLHSPAHRGYYTRRILRARIDEAIARSVLMPGYELPNPNLPPFTPANLAGMAMMSNGAGEGRMLMNKPVMFEEWIGGGEKEGGEKEGWDIKVSVGTISSLSTP
jgi:hypothetical protein